MREEIIELLEDGEEVKVIAEKYSHNYCTSDAFEEEFTNCCGEDSDCYECWKKRIEQIENELINAN